MAAILGALIPNGGPKATSGSHEIILISGPIHYDILLPIDAQTQDAFADLQLYDVPLDRPNAKWLVFGWGASDFYTQTGGYSDLTLSAIWRGVTGDSSVMRVDVAGPLPADLSTQTLHLNDVQYAGLIKAIRNSFANGPLDALPIPGFTNTDVFFAGEGRFHILRTCNVWVGEVMQSAGIRFGIWTPVPLSVRLSHAIYQHP